MKPQLRSVTVSVLTVALAAVLTSSAALATRTATVTPGWICVPTTAGQASVSGGYGVTPSCAAGTTPVQAPTYIASGLGGKPWVNFDEQVGFESPINVAAQSSFTAPVSIAAPVSITSPATLSGQATFSAATTFSDEASFAARATFSGPATFASSVTSTSVNTGELTVDGAADFTRSGVAKIGSNKSSVTVSKVGLDSKSSVLATLQGHAAGIWVEGASKSASASTITIFLNKAPKAPVSVAWFVIN